MLSTAIVLEIRRLLDEGRLSQRQIAEKLGAGRSTVQAIANGRRDLHGRESLPSVQSLCELEAIPTRCTKCGGMVFKPCLLCRARAFQQRLRQFRRRNIASSAPRIPRRVA